MTSKNLKPHSLKHELISSLKALSHKNKEINDAIVLLSHSTIVIDNEGQEKELLQFIWKLIKTYPAVMQDPTNQQLRDFCLHLISPQVEKKINHSFK